MPNLLRGPPDGVKYTPFLPGVLVHGTNLCPLHGRLDRVMKMTEEVLGETTIAEMLAHSGSVTPLCEAKNTVQLGKGGGRLAKRRGKGKS